MNNIPFVNVSDKYRSETYLLKERNDCTVKALTSALDITYVEAHSKLKAFGRKDRNGTFMNEYLDQSDFVEGRIVYKGMIRLGVEYKKEQGCSVGRFVKENSRALYLLTGAIYGWKDSDEEKLKILMEKHNLEQQAKGVIDAATNLASPYGTIPVDALYEYVKQLRKQSENLK